jgi:ubiquinone biosynthesis protein Coq4
LKTLPPDSLGGNLANFLEKESLAPLVTGPRRKQLHDVVHVLTGYGTDLVGEAEVQAFLLGAKFHPLNLFLGLGLLRAIRRNRVLSPSKLRPRLWQAYQQGRKSRLDVDRWEPELKWALPLSEIQAQLNLQGIG